MLRFPVPGVQHKAARIGRAPLVVIPVRHSIAIQRRHLGAAVRQNNQHLLPLCQGLIHKGCKGRADALTELILVSNEVFSGGTVYAGDTERYLRTLAKINNAAAQRADTVVRVVCGIPVYYKGTKR